MAEDDAVFQVVLCCDSMHHVHLACRAPSELKVLHTIVIYGSCQAVLELSEELYVLSSVTR